MKVKIRERTIDRAVFDVPYLIAEAGVNHEGQIEKAIQMIRDAREAGADAIKFQAYKADKIASKHAPAYWDTGHEKTTSQYPLFKKYDRFEESDFRELAKCSGESGIDFLVTPFDSESADFLSDLVPAFKISSSDITNKPLLEYVAAKRKPILLSTGASSIAEIWRALSWLEEEGASEIVLLHCVLNYPTEDSNAMLGMISHMRSVFPEYPIGYSDHTLPGSAEQVLTTAWLLGAQVLEKHFTWNKNLEGNDHYHSLDRDDMRLVVERIRHVKKLVGRCDKGFLPSEQPARLYARRSLVAARFIRKGEILSEQDILIKRPGTGIPPWMIGNAIGATALDDIQEDEILTYPRLRLNSDSDTSGHG
jgi:N-acetylneuraminate synthase